MENVENKKSILKNVLATLGCAVFAGAAVVGVSCAVGSYLAVNMTSSAYSPAAGAPWLSGVDVRVGGSPDIGDKITEWPTQTKEDVNYNGGKLAGKETRKKVSDKERAFLGITGTDVTEAAGARYGLSAGVYVTGVVGGTAADKAGIVKGDIVTYMDGEQLTGMDQLLGVLEFYAAGTDVDLVVMRQRDGEYIQQTITVTLGAKE